MEMWSPSPSGGPPVYQYNLKAPTGTGSGVEGTYTGDDVRNANAPAGYEWNPIEQKYERTPTSAGSRANQYANAASGGFLQSALQGLGVGGSSSSSSSGPLSAFGIGGGMGGTGTGTGGPVGGGQPIAPMQMADTTGSENASFAMAKDRVGQQSRAALSSLNDELGAQGMLGSGAQVQGARDIIQSGQGELGDVRRQQAVTHAGLAQDTAKTNYAGSLTQRGQDIQSQEANARLAFEQNQAARQQQMQLLTMALSGLGGSY